MTFLQTSFLVIMVEIASVKRKRFCSVTWMLLLPWFVDKT